MMQIMFQMQLLFMTGAILLLISRPLLAKFPRVISYGLWCVLFLRLLCPFSLDVDSALWPMQNIVDLAEQKQQTDAVRETQENGKEIGLMQKESGDFRNQPGQLDAEKDVPNQAGVSGQDGMGKTVSGQIRGEDTDSAQIEVENHIDKNGQSWNQSGNADMAAKENQGSARLSEETSDFLVGQEDTVTDMTGGWRQALQMAGSKLESAVINFLASLYYWLKDHALFLMVVWMLGMIVYFGSSLYTVRKYGQYVREAMPCPDRERVYESGQIASPFVFGMFHKKIILPNGLPETEREYIICHEEMHLRRKDDLIKWIVFLLNGIYWFQPLVWVAAYFMEQDMEMSCDEMVVRKMGDQIKKAYAQSLLSFAGGRVQEMFPISFASGGVKGRIKNVLQPKRFKKWMPPVAVILVLSFAVVLFTEQKGQKDRRFQENQQAVEEATPPADRPDEERLDSSEAEDNLELRIEKNFGKFFFKDDVNPDYETFFIRRYQKYRFDNLLLWKNKGDWCYPKKYEFSFVPSDYATMASQQFPPQLLEDMDTEELLSFILSGEKNVTWGWNTYDNYLMGLSMYYSLYNYLHELMNRKDCAAVVHQHYQRYTEEEVQRYSKRNRSSENGQSKEAINFQLIEGLEWFFMALEGKGVPDELTYGLELERTLDDPMPPQEYVFREDVTHDGIKDTITLHMEALRDESLATGEEETVTVTSGKTGEKIASYTADTVHYGWNCIYLYEDETGKYLVEWKPMMYQGMGTFSLKVFSLKEDGTEDVVFKKKFKFNLNSNNIDFDQEEYKEYIKLVNSYLKNSYVIVDTDQGEVMYGTKEGQLVAPYDGSWVIDDYKELVLKKTVGRKE